MDDNVLKIVYAIISFLAIVVSSMLGFFFKRTMSDSDIKFSKMENKMDTLNTRVFDSMERMTSKIEALSSEVFLIKGMLTGTSKDSR